MKGRESRAVERREERDRVTWEGQRTAIMESSAQPLDPCCLYDFLSSSLPPSLFSFLSPFLPPSSSPSLLSSLPTL
jgi:hypothetical protein